MFTFLRHVDLFGQWHTVLLHHRRLEADVEGARELPVHHWDVGAKNAHPHERGVICKQPHTVDLCGTVLTFNSSDHGS